MEGWVVLDDPSAACSILLAASVTWRTGWRIFSSLVWASSKCRGTSATHVRYGRESAHTPAAIAAIRARTTIAEPTQAEFETAGANGRPVGRARTAPA